jgi:hypothetical protein
MSHDDADSKLRRQLRQELTASHAHAGFDRAFAAVPREHRGARVEGIPHSLWENLEHLRLALWDILGFSRGPGHVSPKWPDGYWPASPAPADDAAWEGALASFRGDLAAFCALLEDGGRELHEPFPWGDGQTLLREALVILDHNAYHVGQAVALRQHLGSWPPAGE